MNVPLHDDAFVEVSAFDVVASGDGDGFAAAALAGEVSAGDVDCVAGCGAADAVSGEAFASGVEAADVGFAVGVAGLLAVGVP
jgi:hypothetical protein